MSSAVVTSTLAECEFVIERGLATFVEVGTALMRIRDERLYRETSPTFEDYCRERWGFTDRHARRLMESAEVVALIETGPIGPVVNEAQARELAPVLRDHGPEKAAAVYREATQRSNGRPPARVIREVRAEVIEPLRNEAGRIVETPEARERRLAFEREVEAVGPSTDEGQRLMEDPAEAIARLAIRDRLMAAVAAVDTLRSEHEAQEIAACIPEAARAKTWRELRRAGAFLGQIALLIDEGRS